MRDGLPWPIHRGGMELRVPFDLGLSLLCGQAFRWRQRPDGGFRGIIGGTVVDVWQRRPNQLRWESGPLELSVEEVSTYLRLDDDLEAIRRSIGDPKVDAAFARYQGLRILRQDPWETLISFVISQVSNVPRISRSVEALASNFGHHLGDGVSNSFPSPSELAQVDEASLRLLGLGYRAPHIRSIANAVADGELFLEPLKFMDYEEAKGELTGLPGVGLKVADCTLLFSLEQLRAFPVDRWVIRAVQDWYLGGEKMTQERIGRWAREHFGEYAGYAGQYLFHSRRVGGEEYPAPVARGGLEPLTDEVGPDDEG